MNNLPSLWPGVVKTYDGATRICTVEIPGITDGSDQFPEAVTMPSLGDRAIGPDPKDQTEIRILVGDPVWLMFEGGDPRFPIIVGYRTPRVGNPVDWRRWRHANIEMTAEGIFRINATAIEMNAETVTTTASTVTTNADNIADNAAVAINGGSLTHNGKNVGSNHTHLNSGGPSNGGPPA